MIKATRIPILGVTIAIVVNAAMDGVGLSDSSFSSLLPLLLFFWAIDRIPRKAMGIALGRIRDYGLAVLHPLAIVGAIALICFGADALDVSAANWINARGEFLIAVAINVPLALLTEEGFFRGWLFGSLQRAGVGEFGVVLCTAIAFALWHIPAVALNTEDALPLAQIPVLLINAVVIGVIWGMLRSISGSILVTSICHAVWNACVYVLFGFGTTVGVLGVKQTAFYGPESGFWGLGLNIVFAALLWQWWKRERKYQPYDRR